MLHINIKPDTIFTLFGIPFTNTLLNSYILIIVFFIVALYFSYLSKNNPTNFLVFIFRFICSKLYNLFRGVLEEKTERFFVLFASLFLFILFSNWLGLLPGVGSVTVNLTKLHENTVITEVNDPHGSQKEETKNNEVKKEHIVPLLKGSTADLNTTVGLAMIMVILIQYYGIVYCGLKGYLGKFINLANPVAFFTGILDIVSELSKIISFAFRLFGNIFAGEVLLAVVAFLVPVLASFPFLMLEIFVGFIQALVFTLLGSIFLQVATIKHH
jgi:F-type H+-transporting ATPase subunit a